MTPPRPTDSPKFVLLTVSALMAASAASTWVWAAGDDSLDTMVWMTNRVLILVAAIGLAFSGIGFGVVVGGARRLPAAAQWLIVAVPIMLAIAIAGYLDASYTPPAAANVPSPGNRDPFSGHPESSSVIATGLFMSVGMALAVKWARRLRDPNSHTDAASTTRQ